MKIGLISYDYMHLKTEQVFEGLLRRGFDLTFYLLPFVKRDTKKVTMFELRPNQVNSVTVRELALYHNLKINYLKDPPGGFRL